MRELHRQLAYAPPAARRRHMDAAERLAAEIDAEQVYPQEFVIFRITGYRPDRAEAPVGLVGEALLTDLVTIIQRLSRSLALPPQRAGYGAVPLDDLARRFPVSPKTVQRYRRRGLICHAVTFPDGVQRLACFEDALERFMSRNRPRLEAAASFSRLPAPVRQSIIGEARQHRRQEGVSLNAAARRLAGKYGRAPETVRSLLLEHDRQGGDPIFAEPGPLRTRDLRVIHRAFRFGVPVGVLARRFGRTPATIHRVLLERRAELLRSLDLHPASGPGPGEKALAGAAAGLLPRLPQGDALALIEAACRPDRPNEAAERAWVDAYRVLRHRAARAIAALPERPSASRLDEIETDLRWMAILKRLLAERGLPGALGAAEQAIGRRLAEQPAQEIRAMVRMAVEAVDETIESGSGAHTRLRSRSAFVMARRLAAAGHNPPARRAAMRHDLGSVTMTNPFEALCPRHARLGLRGDLAAHVPAQEAGERRLVVLRYGLEGHRPLAIRDLAEELRTTPSAAARRLRAAERTLRAAGRSTAVAYHGQP